MCFKKTNFVLVAIYFKDYKEDTRDLILDGNEYKKFVKNHIKDVDKILKKLKEVDLIIFLNKFNFRIDKIMIVRHLYRRYGRKSNLKKIDALPRMKANSSITKVKRFLEACVFY